MRAGLRKTRIYGEKNADGSGACFAPPAPCVPMVVGQIIHKFLIYMALPTGLLQTTANRGDPLSVEAEPVHSARVAGMLDLDATIHDD